MSINELREGYEKIQKLFSEEIQNGEKFTDDFLDALIEYQRKVEEILKGKGKTKEEIKKILDKNTDEKVKKAVDLILSFSRPEEKNIGFTLFKKGEKKVGEKKGNNIMELRTLDKYDEFLRVYHRLFFGNKNVKIDVFIENLNKDKMRKIPYKIIHFYGNQFSRTFLISDQVGEVSLVYDGIIEINEDNFINISKGEKIDGKQANKITYSKNYAKKLEHYLSSQTLEDEAGFDEKNENIDGEEAIFDEIYHKTIFSSITDKDGTPINIDLKTIGMTEFSGLYFGIGTRFRRIGGFTLLKYNGGKNNSGLKKILKLGGIERPDLQDEKIDFNNPDHIKEIFTNITDENGKTINIDLKKVGMKEFSGLYFGEGTKFGRIGGYILLKYNGGRNLIILKKVLLLGGIERPDLPNEKINYNNTDHIKEIFTNITDEFGKRIDIDLETIGRRKFGNLYFGRGTKFGQVSGKTLLKSKKNPTPLKIVLVLGGIERPDLPNK
ncbi:hypothetical protein HGA92_03440 [Candidatus Gracilibacteria bacterium]|nr:hypothetical protein [Candidatus Gracilibacteria bacterium]NUJ99151.1 hypothetical protein [Candidatus Gracilibacteria bacterium]